jgi:hypothetical protein
LAKAAACTFMILSRTRFPARLYLYFGNQVA